MPIIAFLVSLLALLIASYTDLKERLVNDHISLALIAVAILLFGATGLLENNWQPATLATLAGIGTFIGSYLLWQIGFWAGGDVKLFTALAVLNPINWFGVPTLLNTTAWFPETQLQNAFPLFLFVFSVLALLPVGILMAIGKIMQEPAKLKKMFPEPQENAVQIALFALTAAGSETILATTGYSSLLVIPLLIVFGLLPKTAQKITGVLLGITGLALGTSAFAVLAIEAMIGFSLAWIALKLFFGVRQFFRTEKKVSELKEGDIPTVTIVQRAETIEIIGNESLWETIKNKKKQGFLPMQGKEICSQYSANGLEKEQIEQLQALAREGKIPTTIELKESTAFIPGILVGYVFLNTFGNPLLKIL